MLSKLGFGLALFLAIMGSWIYLRPMIVNRFPLPDSISDDAAKPCAVWFLGSSSISRWKTLDVSFADWQAHNRGIDGSRLPQIKARALRTTSSAPPAGLVLYAGENDIAAGATGVDAASAMIGLIDTVRTRWPGVPVFVISLKPSPARWLQRDEHRRYNNIVRDFADRQRDVTMITAGMSLLRNGTPDPGLYADDVHLNAAGYALWSKDIRRGLARAVARRHVTVCRAPEAAQTRT